MGEKGEGSGGKGGGKWGERGRELGMGYPPVHPLVLAFAVLGKRLKILPSLSPRHFEEERTNLAAILLS